MRKVIGVAAMLAMGLAACTPEKAPSEKLKDAAEDLVQEATGAEPPPQLAEGKWAPRDECGDSPGAESFRNSLAEAVKARDVDALAALAASDVKLDFGGGSGTGELKARLMHADRSLWDELDDLLTLGCAANGPGGVIIPWFAAQEVDGADPYESMLVTGEAVPLRLEASPKAEEVGSVSWDVVTLVDGLHPEEAYQKVQTADGKTGFINTAKLRSLLDYRLIASSRDGKWSITSLVAGD